MRISNKEYRISNTEVNAEVNAEMQKEIQKKAAFLRGSLLGIRRRKTFH